MKVFFVSILLSLGIWQVSTASQSQIILINAEAYLVDLDDHYDVEKVHMKVPNYFSSSETHEDLLAYYVDNLNRDSRLSSIEETSIEAEHIAEVEITDNEATKDCPFFNRYSNVSSTLGVHHNIEVDKNQYILDLGNSHPQSLCLFEMETYDQIPFFDVDFNKSKYPRYTRSPNQHSYYI